MTHHTPLNPHSALILSMGDPCGIGPEITQKAWQALKSDPDIYFCVIAPPALYTEVPVKPISDPQEAKSVFATALPVLAIDGEPVIKAQPSPAHARAVTASIEKAVGYIMTGQARGLVTNPIAKEVLYEAGFKFPGHTEFLGELTRPGPLNTPYPQCPQVKGPVMMLMASGLRVALATIHLPLSEVPKHLSRDVILNKARILNGALQTDFGIKNPRIALTGLNPHAGEGGALGLEETEIINPAAEILRQEGMNITLAQPADTLFHAEARQTYDAVLAMYHDQGLIPVKTLDFHGGVNITLGLPIIRTSPDHGTAFNIAGQNKARPDSLIAAIKAAHEIAAHRFSYGCKHAG